MSLAPAPPLVFGEHRIRAGWIGIGISAAALVMVTPPLLSVGSPGPLLAVAPILLAFAALCAITRMVTIDPQAGTVRVERRLLGLRWRRTWRLSGAYVVAAEWFWAMSRHARSDGTLLGDQRFMHYRILLDGRPRILLEVIFGNVEAAERSALRVAAALGLPAERRGYTREPQPGGGRLAVRRKGWREPMA